MILGPQGKKAVKINYDDECNHIFGLVGSPIVHEVVEALKVMLR